MGKRELIALLNLSSWCLVMVERLFLAVPRGCLQFVIVVFPDHTHLLFLFTPKRRQLSCHLFGVNLNLLSYNNNKTDISQVILLSVVVFFIPIQSNRTKPLKQVKCWKSATIFCIFLQR